MLFENRTIFEFHSSNFMKVWENFPVSQHKAVGSFAHPIKWVWENITAFYWYIRAFSCSPQSVNRLVKILWLSHTDSLRISANMVNALGILLRKCIGKLGSSVVLFPETLNAQKYLEISMNSMLMKIYNFNK